MLLPKPRRQLTLQILACLLVGQGMSLLARTSYLVVQGQFVPGGSAETHHWMVTYGVGNLSTGFDLLKAVFGEPALDPSSYADDFGGVYEHYSSAGSTQGVVGYINFGSNAVPLLFTESITIQGSKLAMNPAYDPGWNYYVKGGSGTVDPTYNPDGLYNDPTGWEYSSDSIHTRILADGSMDGWVFGATYPEAPMEDTGDLPLPGSSSWTLVSNQGGVAVYALLVPEPDRALLVLSGMMALAVRRRRPITIHTSMSP